MTPVPSETAAQPSGSSDAEIEVTATPTIEQKITQERAANGQDGPLLTVAPPPEEKEEKKKKKKSKSKKAKKPKPTGFEEYYADAPLTPQEAEEEREDLYHPSKPFAERIETSLHRYRTKRRIQGTKVGYFNEYLFLGGIDCQPNMFQGGGNYEDGLGDDEEPAVSGVEMVHGGSGGPIYYNSNFPKHWDVDFTGVVAGYLSTSVPRLNWGRDSEVAQAIGVVTNFLRYLKIHDVCPEYDEDITRAMGLCEIAGAEMRDTADIFSMFPGQFNLACQELFLTDHDSTAPSSLDFERPGNFDAEGLFSATMKIMGDAELQKNTTDIKALHVVNEEECDLEVVSIHRPDESQSDAFRGTIPKTGPPDVPPIGKLMCKHVLIEDDIDHGQHPRAKPPASEETLFLDDEILTLLKPGMKFRGTLCGLSAGFMFFKDTPEVLPSYYTFLPQVLMKRYKEPVPNPRPAPSASNPLPEDGEAGEGAGSDDGAAED